LFVEAVLHRYRPGIPSRSTGTLRRLENTHLRFSRWEKSGVWKRVFEIENKREDGWAVPTLGGNRMKTVLVIATTLALAGCASPDYHYDTGSFTPVPNYTANAPTQPTPPAIYSPASCNGHLNDICSPR
jgi:hypothetical protein